MWEYGRWPERDVAGRIFEESEKHEDEKVHQCWTQNVLVAQAKSHLVAAICQLGVLHVQSLLADCLACEARCLLLELKGAIQLVAHRRKRPQNAADLIHLDCALFAKRHKHVLYCGAGQAAKPRPELVDGSR